MMTGGRGGFVNINANHFVTSLPGVQTRSQHYANISYPHQERGYGGVEEHSHEDYEENSYMEESYQNNQPNSMGYVNNYGGGAAGTVTRSQGRTS